jgi:hypothetical protein
LVPSEIHRHDYDIFSTSVDSWFCQNYILPNFSHSLFND